MENRQVWSNLITIGLSEGRESNRYYGGKKVFINPKNILEIREKI